MASGSCDAPIAELDRIPNLDDVAYAEIDGAGLKRKADDTLDMDDGSEDQTNKAVAVDASQPVSKRQLKRLKRQQAWEEARDDRKAKRKDKRHERQVRKRAEKEELKASGAHAVEQGRETNNTSDRTSGPAKSRSVPITFMIDCDFERYMKDSEIVSLSNQITRSYSENRRAPLRANLVVSSFHGKLKQRFDTTMGGHHTSWKGIHFVDEDFIQAAKGAQAQMRVIREVDLKKVAATTDGNRTAIASETRLDSAGCLDSAASQRSPATEQDVNRHHIVYLTSDSPNTLSTLDEDTVYVIGGIVDRNREKGLCFKRAQDHNVRTAKLPIGEYLAMSSRHVLTTNQVVEIMCNYLSEKDWGKAFIKVIPQRKGGTLKDAEPPAFLAEIEDRNVGTDRAGATALDQQAQNTAQDDHDVEFITSIHSHP